MDWLQPLQVHPITGEPILRLPHPHENIIITPPRMSDGPALVTTLNDLRVCQWLESPPYPYTDDDADYWLRMVKDGSDTVLQELKDAFDEESGSQRSCLVGSCPVSFLREVQKDGTEIYLGSIGVERCHYPELENGPEKAKLVKENADRDVGDPEIVWCIGGIVLFVIPGCLCIYSDADYLVASHHNRGIMSAAAGTIIREWVIPKMAARKIRVETFVGNVGSRRVFEKNGFVLAETVTFSKERVTNSGTRQQGMDILWLRS
ncbi:hypothetical protein NLI96_g2014 [Meripilus lineatus]|uniref:N-acetyltransferase domain-containing protein n=1 Tax=Meripilus lineatus TaxID=2056292 RepID=A0AAD5V9K5_9APHY|nr:hypothetical protein NLI96_g2014 [Physisporinus lineatus]